MRRRATPPAEPSQYRETPLEEPLRRRVTPPAEPSQYRTTPAEPPRYRPASPLEPSPLRPVKPAQATSLRSLQQKLPVGLIGPLGLGLLAGCLAFFIIGIGLLGAYQGLRIRNQNLSTTATEHYQRGVSYMEQGNYEMAIAEFEEALKQRPGYPEAQEKLLEAQSKASNAPLPTPGSQGDPATLLNEGRAAYERGTWEEAIQKLETLQRVDPNYEQSSVQRLLVGAYTQSGLQLVNDGGMEEAIRRFDQVLALQPGNLDVKNQRELAVLYQSGLSAWGVNWGKAIENFATLYNRKADYKDTGKRLLDAYQLAGDAAGAASGWCDAAQYYKAALELASTPELATKRDDAVQRCASADAVNSAPSGTFIGTYGGLEDIHTRTTDWTKIHGRVLNARGEGLPDVKVKISAYDWSTEHTTDATGYYMFEFLNNEITFTVTLVDRPVLPVDVPTKFGFAALANFNEKP